MSDLARAGSFRRQMCGNPPTHDYPQYKYRGEWMPRRCSVCMNAEIERLRAALAEILLVPPYAGEEGLSRCLTVAAAALEGK